MEDGEGDAAGVARSMASRSASCMVSPAPAAVSCVVGEPAVGDVDMIGEPVMDIDGAAAPPAGCSRREQAVDVEATSSKSCATSSRLREMKKMIVMNEARRTPTVFICKKRVPDVRCERCGNEDQLRPGSKEMMSASR